MSSFEQTRQAMKEMICTAPVLSEEAFGEILVQHHIFLEHGGAGGYWETFYIKNLIFGVYRQSNPNEPKGEQAKLSFNNLKEINLAGISLSYADCAGVYAPQCHWTEADLEGSLFVDSILNGCSFQKADLYAADFSRSDMRNCDFRGASLLKTDFENCDLSGSDFRGCQIDRRTRFKNAILVGVKRDALI